MNATEMNLGGFFNVNRNLFKSVSNAQRFVQIIKVIYFSFWRQW